MERAQQKERSDGALYMLHDNVYDLKYVITRPISSPRGRHPYCYTHDDMLRARGISETRSMHGNLFRDLSVLVYTQWAYFGRSNATWITDWVRDLWMEVILSLDVYMH